MSASTLAAGEIDANKLYSVEGLVLLRKVTSICSG